MEDFKPDPIDLVVPDIVLEECDDAKEEDEEPGRRSSCVELLQVEKTRRRVRSKYSESHPDVGLDPFVEQASLYSAPSLFSVMSNYDGIEIKNEVRESN